MAGPVTIKLHPNSSCQNDLVCRRAYETLIDRYFFFSGRRRHTSCYRDWSSDVCSSDLLADLGDRPALEAGGAPPRWLERVRERIHDEFARALTLAALAETGGVHRVHLARAFRWHYRCTVGEYIRQRRGEFVCHRLTGPDDRLD